jgi:hypothetical protein
MFIASKGGRTTRQLGKKGIIVVCTRKVNKLKYKAAGQRERWDENSYVFTRSRERLN